MNQDEALRAILAALVALPSDHQRETVLCTAQHKLRNAMLKDHDSHIFPASLSMLAQTLPGLKMAPVLGPEHLWEWARGGRSSGEYHAAVFILNVWNSSEGVPWPRFDLFAAYGTWDEAHMNAFQAWALAPWGP